MSNHTLSNFNIDDYKNYTLEELSAEMYKYHPQSERWAELRGLLETMYLTDTKYDEMLVVFPSDMIRDRSINTPQLIIDGLNQLNDIQGIVALSNYDYPEFGVTNQYPLSYRTSFLEDLRFSYTDRRSVEYNPVVKQMVVAAFITDGDNLILLKALDQGDPRIVNKYTFIQGHVSFSPEIYTNSQLEYLKLNIKREIEEELTITDETSEIIEKIDSPYFFINDRSNPIGLEHFGVVYEIKVDNAKRLYEKLESGEKDKHTVELIPLKDINDYIDKMDNWCKMYIDRLIKQTIVFK